MIPSFIHFKKELKFLPGGDIAPGSITSVQIASATILAGNIANATIVGDNIAAATITATQIANATITGTQIAAATINGSNIASATINGGNIASATIQGGNIGAATITGGNIASATITGANVAAGTITGGNIGSGTILAGNISALTITAGEIANLTITAGKIANATITGAKIDSATITGGNIVGGTITGSLIATATITAANIAAHTITASEIAAATITASEIAAATITAAKMVVGTITAASGIIADINADTITSGSIRGINVNASSHTTKGSYLTSAPSGGAGTLDVKNTADFSGGGGSGWIIDTTNDRDAFTYTGKTATTLTGCSGVLAHNAGATIIPQAKGVVIDGLTNELRFYGDRGDGTIVELLSLGDNPGFGNSALVLSGGSTIYLLRIEASSTIGAVSLNNTGSGATLVVGNSGTGDGVSASSNAKNGGRFDGNATRGNLSLLNCNGATFPTNKTANQLAQVGDRLFYADGTNWLPLTHPYFESTEQALTNSTDTAVAHGLGRIPRLAQVVIRCKTTEFGYAVNDEINVGAMGDSQGAQRDCSLYVNATNVGFSLCAGGISIARRDAGQVGNLGNITNANWKAVLRAW